MHIYISLSPSKDVYKSASVTQNVSHNQCCHVFKLKYKRKSFLSCVVIYTRMQKWYIGWRARFFPTCQPISWRVAVSKENAKHMPMKWPIGLSFRVVFSSVTPRTWKGFVQSFEVDELLQIDVNIEAQAEKGFFFANKKWGKWEKKIEKTK